MRMRGLPADLANSSVDESRQATSGADTSGASINFEICFFRRRIHASFSDLI